MIKFALSALDVMDVTLERTEDRKKTEEWLTYVCIYQGLLSKRFCK